jgi:hypothetical protein
MQKKNSVACRVRILPDSEWEFSGQRMPDGVLAGWISGKQLSYACNASGNSSSALSLSISDPGEGKL